MFEWRRRLTVALAAVLVGTMVGPVTDAVAEPDYSALVGITAAGDGEPCGPANRAPVGPEPAPPMLVTNDCVDPRYGQPQVDAVALNAHPVPHVVTHVRFLGTPGTAAYYFPLEGDGFEYRERFVQGPVHQLRLTGEIASPQEIAFAAAHGAYVVQSNPNQDYALTGRDAVSGRYDPALGGYRLPAAAAKFSEDIARAVYGYDHDPVGLYYGGSGGGYLSVSAAEMTSGVWDGVVPFVMGTPNSIPTVFTVRLHALRVLRERDKWPCVMDAIEPGGSGDPYQSCELNADEAAALREATQAGFEPRAWYSHASMDGGPLSLVAMYTPLLDPTYAEDFWTQPGYLGTEQSSAGESVRKARINHPASVIAAAVAPAPPYDAMGPAYNAYMLSQYITGPVGTITLDSLPPGGPPVSGPGGLLAVPGAPPSHPLSGNADLCVETGAAAGKCLTIGTVNGATNTLTLTGGQDPEVAGKIRPGDRVRISNDWQLSLQTNGRHQVVPDELGGMGGTTTGWDQYRRLSCTPVGNSGRCKGGSTPERVPIYPQRSVLTGPRGAYAGSGSISTGQIKTKVVVAGSVMDIEAFPWQSAWYEGRVRDALAARGENVDDHFRIYFTDHAQHGGTVPDGGGGAATRTVSYRGTLEQALVALWEWVQDGKPPAPSSRYDLVGGLVRLAPTASERGGVQPVVDLRVNGGVRADVTVGEPVEFTATITVPPGAGKVVAAEWSALGDAFTAAECAACDGSADTVTIETTFTYSEPGTYFPAVRGASKQYPDSDYGRQDNLGRARVVVAP